MLCDFDRTQRHIVNNEISGIYATYDFQNKYSQMHIDHICDERLLRARATFPVQIWHHGTCPYSAGN